MQTLAELRTDTGVRFEVLGPLRVVAGGEVRQVSAPKMACVLTALLLRANQVVSKDALIAEIWGDNPPRRATPALHVYISQLRKLLSTPEDPDGPILTRPPGYLVRTGPDDLDCDVLQRLVSRGRDQLERGQLRESAQSFEDALALWRGPVQHDPGVGPITAGFFTWSEEYRLECLESYVEVSLQLGRHRTVVSLLVNLVKEFPLHEALYAQLMRALSACGRRADALQVYQKARLILDEQLGLEPGPKLRQLQSSLLGSDSRRPARLAS